MIATITRHAESRAAPRPPAQHLRRRRPGRLPARARDLPAPRAPARPDRARRVAAHRRQARGDGRPPRARPHGRHGGGRPRHARGAHVAVPRGARPLLRARRALGRGAPAPQAQRGPRPVAQGRGRLATPRSASRPGGRYTKVNRCLAEGRKRFLERYAGIEAGEECRRWQPMLSAIVDGEATGEQLMEVRPHLRNCGALPRDAPRAARRRAPRLCRGPPGARRRRRPRRTTSSRPRTSSTRLWESISADSSTSAPASTVDANPGPRSRRRPPQGRGRRRLGRRDGRRRRRRRGRRPASSSPAPAVQQPATSRRHARRRLRPSDAVVRHVPTGCAHAPPTPRAARERGLGPRAPASATRASSAAASTTSRSSTRSRRRAPATPAHAATAAPAATTCRGRAASAPPPTVAPEREFGFEKP